MSYLENVNSPKDIKKLNIDELDALCDEIRELMIDTVSKNGGHLASNLGAVELTVAMHKVFNSPSDQFVFDVGHQCYTHKILTGRKDSFSTLRTEGGISGFTRPCESNHDIFSSGHSSTSISAAIGLAKAKTLNGDKGKVIAVIGDGALTGGLAYEALNNAGNEHNNLIVILNDNNMSISDNVGSMAKNLNHIRISPKYFTFKSKIQHALSRVPKIGAQVQRFITITNTKIRKRLYHSTVFEDLGFRYYGPIDGHDLESLIDVLTVAKAHNNSVLVHVNTLKGKGYEFAEKNPSKFHGIGKFDIETGEPLSSGENYSSVFGDYLCELAKKDKRICAITAAMSTGTGLVDFSYKYPERFFDVGIAEEHAVTFSSGLAKNGMIPFFAVYSTFLQRSYDQLVHDVAMQDLKVIFGIDRAGFVGEDGESHQGVFDTAYLMSVPNLSVFAPSSFDELREMMYQAAYRENHAVAIRYPRGGQGKIIDGYKYERADFDTFGDTNAKKCVVSFGREFLNIYDALGELDNTFAIKLNRIKPINPNVLDLLKNVKTVYFFEEGIKSGGVGECFGSMLAESDVTAKFRHICIEDEFIKQASVESQLKKYRLDKESIIDIVNQD
ncbi:1-deoxy-D-xylulose-5-phosphate synthase [Eubacterium coprostanoligenes]|uniref:1-deoxy-D-xylulose-5-phosphate synthase n=1 Tax=Eubacterium coprostanoligenes TaxID=290054 RepID=UPI0023552E7C|nr:1-deoxy-D-xylulose-5-phosphate synthase [Eubacterium coprostanoligenes]MCI6253733.1 1-deoxy-D-xylulose-5-phosphate synthase [Eubacterium coprostanoligenes]MDY5399521.1 1-deoxy-D-xylulose-5-phosphate synthase [Eubacterium coprostanoligenes]